MKNTPLLAAVLAISFARAETPLPARAASACAGNAPIVRRVVPMNLAAEINAERVMGPHASIYAVDVYRVEARTGDGRTRNVDVYFDTRFECTASAIRLVDHDGESTLVPSSATIVEAVGGELVGLRPGTIVSLFLRRQIREGHARLIRAAATS